MWEAGVIVKDWVDANGWRHIKTKSGNEYFFRHSAAQNSRPTQRALDGAKAPKKSKRSVGTPRK